MKSAIRWQRSQGAHLESMAALWEDLEVAKPNKLVPVPKSLFSKLFTETTTTTVTNIVAAPEMPIPKPKPEAMILNLEHLISTDVSSGGSSSGRLSSQEEREEEEQQQQRRARCISSEVMRLVGDCDPDCGEDYCEEKEVAVVAPVIAAAAFAAAAH